MTPSNFLGMLAGVPLINPVEQIVVGNKTWASSITSAAHDVLLMYTPESFMKEYNTYFKEDTSKWDDIKLGQRVYVKDKGGIRCIHGAAGLRR